MNSPNIVFLLLDAARADHFSCYGYHRETTPYIDTLAKDGSFYNNAYSNSIWSLPAYASLFTGKYPSSHGAVDWSKSIDPNSNILVNNINKYGYETSAVTTHLLTCGHGIADAFDQATWIKNPSRLPYPDDPVIESIERDLYSGKSLIDSIPSALKTLYKDRSFETLPNAFSYTLREVKYRTGYWEDDGASNIIEQSKHIIDEASDPFFLFANFVETHDPYRPPKKYIDKFLPESVSISEANQVAQNNMVDLSLGIDSISSREKKILIALYDSEIRYIDDKIKELSNYLKKQGKLDNTVFVVCSDHGDLFDEWGLWGHQGAIHRNLCRVPLIVSAPWEQKDEYHHPVELRQLAEYLPKIASGSQMSIPEKEGAVVEYHGWDCQISNDQWDKFDEDEKKKWGTYSSSYLTRNWQLLIDANGNKSLYSRDEKIDEINNDHTSKINKFENIILESVGNPRDNHDTYRAEANKSEKIENMSDEVKQHLKDLGYA